MKRRRFACAAALGLAAVLALVLAFDGFAACRTGRGVARAAVVLGGAAVIALCAVTRTLGRRVALEDAEAVLAGEGNDYGKA